MKRNLICKLWGHDLDPEASYYYAADHCRRCDQHAYQLDTGLREWLLVRCWVARRWILDRLQSWGYWLKCTDCGQRFGRHDESVDHLPF